MIKSLFIAVSIITFLIWIKRDLCFIFDKGNTIIENIFILYCLCVPIFNINYSSSGVEDIGVNLSVFRMLQRILGILLGLFVILFLKPPNQNRLKKPFVYFYVLALVFFIGLVLNSDQKFYSLARFMEFLSVIIVLDYMGKFGKSKRAIDVYFTIFKVFLYCQPIFGLLIGDKVFLNKSESYFGGFQFNGVFPIINPNGISLYASILLFITLFEKNNGKFKTNVYLLFLIMAIVLSNSRTTLITVIIFGFIYLIKSKSKFAPLLKGGIFVAIPIFISTWIDLFYKNILVRGNEAQLTSMSGRTYYWEYALEVFKDFPIFGAGYAFATRFRVMAALGHGEGSTLHNSYIEVLLNGGVLGLIIFVFILLNTFKKLYFAREISLLFIFFIILIKSLTNTIGIYNDNFLTLGVIVLYASYNCSKPTKLK